ncbi:unnamed protein product [Echinostoma caproni]|uniref:Uncharacterized protein n=1 Tax=Echinostoma caproni TaxID=27848 RepID=A0A183AU27_9TREM|nr:unnamed protein product [Echinostoma caproni]
MNPLIARLQQTHCVSVNDYQDSTSKSGAQDLVVTPQITEHVRGIAQKAGVIRAASQFADYLSPRDESVSPSSHCLNERGCQVLDTLTKHLSSNVMKDCPASELGE